MKRRPVKSLKFNNTQGFTLIEVIVVVAIIGLLATLIVSSMSSDGDRLASIESKRFVAVVNEARDESIISGKVLALSVQEGASQYQFQELTNSWTSMQASSLFKPREVAPEVELDWDIIESPWAQNVQDGLQDAIASLTNEDLDENELKRRTSELKSLQALSKQSILISPLGEIDPFELKFIGNDNVYIAFLDAEGVVSLRTETRF